MGGQYGIPYLGFGIQGNIIKTFNTVACVIMLYFHCSCHLIFLYYSNFDCKIFLIILTCIKIYYLLYFDFRGRPWSMSAQLEPDTKPRDIPYLDNYAMERWECVLHYMVGSQAQEGISADAVRILLHANLMKR